MFFKSSLRMQSLCLIVSSLTLMLIVSLLGVRSMSQQLANYNQLVEGPQATAGLINEANIAFKTQVQEWKNVLLRGRSQADRDRYWQSFQAYEAEVQQLFEQIAERDMSSEMQSQVHTLQGEHRTLGEGYRKGYQQFMSSGFDPFVGDSAVRGIDRDTSDHLDELVDDIGQHTSAEVERIREASLATMLLTILILIGTGFVIALVAATLITKKLVNPVTHLISQIEYLSEGHFREEILSNRQDELGILARAANKLRAFLSETAVGLRNGTDRLDEASEGLSLVAAHMTNGANEQFSRTDQVAAAMQEMSATAAEVARYAAEASSAADAADESSQQGRKVMTETIDAMHQLQQQIQVTSEVVHRLNDDSLRVGKVLEVIQSIADQTNLLALNAAIEAARAGEAGRGFAVVADEVRTLAQRTSESTAEIQMIISSVQTGAEKAAKAIDSGRINSDTSMQQVTLAGDNLIQIVTAVESIRDMNRQIATAAEEQTSVSEEISRNITEITDIAAQTQADVERTSEASTGLQELSACLNELSSKLRG